MRSSFSLRCSGRTLTKIISAPPRSTSAAASAASVISPPRPRPAASNSVRQRSISAIGVVIVGLVPAIMGGPVFAVVLTALCLIGIHEYNAMAKHIGNEIMPTGLVGVAIFGLVAALS